MNVLFFHQIIYTIGMNAPSPSLSELEPLLSIRDAAPFLGKTVSSVKADISRNPESLPDFVKVGRNIYFLPSLIRAWQIKNIVSKNSDGQEELNKDDSRKSVAKPQPPLKPPVKIDSLVKSKMRAPRPRKSNLPAIQSAAQSYRGCK
jgi:hypothetical protein